MRHALLLVTAVVALVVPATEAATIRTTVPSAGMSLALPSSWKRVDARSAATAAAKALVGENPQLAAILDQLGKPDSVVKLFAFDPVGARSFATNVNVVVSPIPRGVTIEQYLAAAQSEIARLPGRVGTPVTYIQTVRGTKVVRSNVRIALRRNGKRIVSDISQWAYLRPGKSVVLSFTTTPAKRARYLPIFAATAASVRFH